MLSRDIPSKFAASLRKAVRESAYSQNALADELGVGHATISRWVNAEGEQPAPQHVFAAERLLGLDRGSLSRHLGYVPVEVVDDVLARRNDPEVFVEWMSELDDVGRELVLIVLREALARQTKN